MNETSLSIEQLKKYFDSRGFSPLVFNVSDVQKHILEDVAIIQSFYGQDHERIAATSNALRAMLQSTDLPQEWIFVEGQKSKFDCAFLWLKKYGIKHIFVKTTSRQDGIFLKTPLWNIGVKNSKSSRLCFVDSDVAFCNSGWLSDVVKKFDNGFGVLSLHGWSYYENFNQTENIDESIGHSLWNEDCPKHYGFTIGMTRSVYDMIKGFKACYILDDLDYWTSIVGSKTMEDISNKWNIDSEIKYGIDTKVGSTEQTICHCDHGEREDRKYRQLVDICLNRCDSIDDIFVYNPLTPEILPVWNLEMPIGRIAYKAVNGCKNSNYKDKSGNDWYFENAEVEFGNVGDGSPLIVVSAFRNSGYAMNIRNILKFKNRIFEKISDVSGFVFFSNVKNGENDENIDMIPFKDECKLDFLQIFRKDVKFPENSNILFIPFEHSDVSIDRILKCQDDVLSISKDGVLYFKYSKKNVQTIRKCRQIGRTIDEFMYFNGIKCDQLNRYMNFSK